MRYNKKNVQFLLVPLLIIIFFSGNAAADTYSFSVSSTFGDRDIFNFTVNSVGTINGEATWTGGAANLALILNGPGQVGYYARKDGPSPLSLSYTVTTTDLSKGTDWRLSIVNFGGGEATGTVTIAYPTGPTPTPPPLPTPTPTLVPYIYIDIDSSPQGAQIWIDGEYSGVTPFRKRFDRPGSHTFKLSLNGYQTYQESFYISESRTIEVILEPLAVETPTTLTTPTPTPTLVPYIYIDIDSSPQGAQIWIDGEYSGVTPFRKRFDRPGSHTFKLSLNGYQSYQERFYISKSGTLKVILEPLAVETPTPPPTPTLVPYIYIDIDSSPQGAQIWIDDEYSGVTPLRKYFDRPGDHTFKLSLNGYQTYQESFFISESRTLDVILEPLEGETPTPFHPSPTPPGFLALSLLIAIFFVYFFKFKNKQ